VGFLFSDMSDKKQISRAGGSDSFDGPFTEPLVARVTGVKKSGLAHARRTRLLGPRWDGDVRVGIGPALDWFLDERQQVVYSRAGLAKLLTGLGIEFAGLDWAAGLLADPAPKKSASEAAPGLGDDVTGLKHLAEVGGVTEHAANNGDAGSGSRGATPADGFMPASSNSRTPTLSSEKIADLTVLRVTGPHRLTARTPDGARVALSVQRSEHFVARMVVPGCRRSGDNALWTFTGRLPRRKGKW
jgi:hypothetical protein